MKKKPLLSTNQRVDGPDMRNLIDFNENEFNILSNQLLSHQQASTIKGFDFSVNSGLLLEIIQEDLVVVTPSGELAFYSQVDPQLTIAMADNSTNYVEAQVFTEETDQQTKAFWDPNAGVSGQEFTQIVSTISKTSMRLVVNQVGFSGDSDKIPVAVVVTSAGVVERIHDNHKNQVLSGSPTNPVFAENLFFRLNDIDSDGFQDNFNFGLPRTDTNIATLKNSLDGIYTQIKDIIGDGRTTAEVSRNNWFDERPTNLFSIEQSRQTSLVGGGSLNFNQGLNQLSFTSDFTISIPSIVGSNVIQTSESPITILNDQVAYITLDRDTAVTNNATVTVVNLTALPLDKDIFIVCRRVSDKIFMNDGTTLTDGATLSLGQGIGTPITTTDTGIAIWDGTTGNKLKNTGVLIDASDNMTIPAGGGAHSISSEFANESLDSITRTVGTSVGVRGVGKSSSCGTATTVATTSFVDVTNLSVTITTTGRPVMLMLMATDTSVPAGGSFISGSDPSVGANPPIIAFFRGGTNVGSMYISDGTNGNATFGAMIGQSHMDFPSAGTYTYKVRYKAGHAANTLSIIQCKLVAVEL